jgi:hypothetical protein
MLDLLKRLFARPSAQPTTVHRAVGAALVGHDEVADGLAADGALVASLQVDGDPAPGRPASAVAAADAPRDAFLVAGGLGLPALALVNVRDQQARVELWALDSSTPGANSTFERRLALRLPAGEPELGWQASQVVSLPRLQALVVLRHDDRPRTALVATLDLATGALRPLGVAEPDPFADDAGHVGTLRTAPDGVLIHWRSGRMPLGRWGDVALEDHVVLFTPRERDGLEVLTLALEDGNIRAWGMRGTTLWLHAIDGRPRPVPRVRAWSLDLARVI